MTEIQKKNHFSLISFEVVHAKQTWLFDIESTSIYLQNMQFFFPFQYLFYCALVLLCKVVGIHWFHLCLCQAKLIYGLMNMNGCDRNSIFKCKNKCFLVFKSAKKKPCGTLNWKLNTGVSSVKYSKYIHMKLK